ncbi:helix-turn-helix domain-containing protein [Streptomyces monomycini]|uniref:helix-turn-helix domain-containing protein n=1 Tax=Streptomyces monomycini TaxID=371720 RepID=UPI00067AD2E3|nr:XRE family transcriptional regulator [Streptomyces monomycini]
MPRWRALPEELDPQVKEFAGQLRGLVERSGLSVAAVADRTGYSKTSWERYLNGRLLPPQRAVIALAEATGTHTGHLTTLWELAERAWSRSEMRHDVTMEAIRVAQARAALGEFGPAPGKPAKSRIKEKAKTKAKDRDAEGGAKGEEQGGGSGQAPTPAAPPQRGDELPSAADFPGMAASPAAPPASPAASPTSPLAPPASPAAPPASPGTTPLKPVAKDSGDTERPDRPDRMAWPRLTADPDAAPVPPPPRHEASPYDVPRQGTGGRTTGPEVARHPAGSVPPAGPPDDTDRQLRRRRVTMFLAGVVGALLVIAAAVLLLDIGGGEEGKQATPAPSASPSKKPVLPAGVKCAGADCAGKDPEAMGCGGRNATSPSRGFAGSSLIEVRYSKVCGAAWARITGAAPGDEASISSAGRTEKAAAGQDGDAYTAMVPVSGDPAKVTACGTTTAGGKGCAKPVPAGSGSGAGTGSGSSSGSGTGTGTGQATG